MTGYAHKTLDELEKSLLTLYRGRVASMNLSALVLRDYLKSSTAFHKLRELRDQVDVCLGNIDEIRMTLYKPPFGTEAEEDEETGG